MAKTPADTPYDIGLNRNPANFQPLTPLGFLMRRLSPSRSTMPKPRSS
jgi:hypothetical protein